MGEDGFSVGLTDDLSFCLNYFVLISKGEGEELNEGRRWYFRNNIK